MRTGNKKSPWPEEVNRILTGHLSDFHFAPTTKAIQNLKKESIKKNVWNVGNTVIDALLLGLSIIEKDKQDKFDKLFSDINFSKKIILVTGHRRESFGKPFENICNAISIIAESYNDIEIIYPVHLNPNVKDIVYKKLSGYKNIKLIHPLEYKDFIYLMNKSYLVLTDSGGIQEEAPSLGKPVLVLRDVTERPEGIEAGTAMLVGTESKRIIEAVVHLLENENAYIKMANAVNPYGDGTASNQIVEIVKQIL